MMVAGVASLKFGRKYTDGVLFCRMYSLLTYRMENSVKSEWLLSSSTYNNVESVRSGFIPLSSIPFNVAPEHAAGESARSEPIWTRVKFLVDFFLKFRESFRGINLFGAFFYVLNALNFPLEDHSDMFHQMPQSLRNFRLKSCIVRNRFHSTNILNLLSIDGRLWYCTGRRRWSRCARLNLVRSMQSTRVWKIYAGWLTK